MPFNETDIVTLKMTLESNLQGFEGALEDSQNCEDIAHLIKHCLIFIEQGWTSQAAQLPISMNDPLEDKFVLFHATMDNLLNTTQENFFYQPSSRHRRIFSQGEKEAIVLLSQLLLFKLIVNYGKNNRDNLKNLVNSQWFCDQNTALHQRLSNMQKTRYMPRVRNPRRYFPHFFMNMCSLNILLLCCVNIYKGFFVLPQNQRILFLKIQGSLLCSFFFFALLGYYCYRDQQKFRAEASLLAGENNLATLLSSSQTIDHFLLSPSELEELTFNLEQSDIHPVL